MNPGILLFMVGVIMFLTMQTVTNKDTNERLNRLEQKETLK